MAIQASHVDEGPKDRHEGRLTRKLSGFLARQHKDLRRQMEAGERAPDEFWVQFEAGLSEILKAELGAVARDGAESVMSQLPNEKRNRRQIVLEIPDAEPDHELRAAVKALVEQQLVVNDALAKLAEAQGRPIVVPASVVNVAPSPVEVSVDVAPIAEALKGHPTQGIGPTSRHEERVLVRDQKGQVIGSRVDVTYDYDEHG
jgi:hypothetical protein